jgi:hypothetical protein
MAVDSSARQSLHRELVIGDRNPLARMTVAIFRASTALMQGAMDRAGLSAAAAR